MSKFKPGDKVVHHRNISPSDSRDQYLGKTLTVASLASRHDGQTCYLVEEDRVFFFREGELELKEVYESPLYQALK